MSYASYCRRSWYYNWQSYDWEGRSGEKIR